MRALHLIKTSVGATWALRQVQELLDLGVEVHVALPAGGPLVERYATAGAIVHPAQFSLPVSRPQRWPALFGQMRELVDRVKPDLVHSHFVGTTLTMRLALGKQRELPRVFQVPGPLHLEHGVFRRAEMATAGEADYWMGSCRWTCDRYLAAGVPTERVFLSYYGSDLDRFVPRPPGKLRAELGIGPETGIVGMIAYLYAPKRYLGQRRGLKGHEDLIDALAIVAQERPNLLGVFVGGPWGNATAYEKRVHAYAAERLGDRARFLGTRHDVPDLYADVDLAVHPSHSENVGGAVESLLLGVPTIATEVGGFPDLIKHHQTGWLVPPKDPARLAATIIEALSDREQARAMATAGQHLAREVMDIRTNAVDVVRAYETMLHDRETSR